MATNRKLKQIHYVVFFVLIAVIAGMVLVDNEQFVGQALRGPLSDKKPTPASSSANLPCPDGSSEIGQAEIDQALTQNRHYGLLITASGDYCLREDIALNFNGQAVSEGGKLRAITIQADQATLNLNGHSMINRPVTARLDDDSGLAREAIVAGIPGQTLNQLIIRNGLIQGFSTGIAVENGATFKNIVIEDIAFKDNYRSLSIHQTTDIELRRNTLEQAEYSIECKDSSD